MPIPEQNSNPPEHPMKILSFLFKKSIILLFFLLMSLGACSDDTQSPSTEKNDILLLADAHFPCYSPDGMEIICSRTTTSLRYCVWRILRKTPISGAPSDTLFEDTSLKYGPMFPKWMPDGEHVVYYGVDQAEEHRYFRIRAVSTDPADPVPLWWQIEIDDMWDDAAFTLTPDGTEVFYTDWTESGNAVFALDLNDESTRPVCLGDQAAISPDGKWIAISSEDSLAIVPTAGGEWLKLEPGWWVAWTPDSRYIVFTGFSEESGDTDLILLSRDGTYREELTNDSDWDLCPAVSPLGGELVYVKTPDADEGPFQLRRLKLLTSVGGGL
jgi:hypothetical protein